MASASEWRRRVEAWRASGEPASVFAPRAGWHPRTLTWWASRLRRDPPVPPNTRAIELVRVVMSPRGAVATAPAVPAAAAAMPPETPAPTARALSSATVPIEVVLVGGRVVRVGGHFDAGVLRAVVEALEQA